jgi:glycerol-3-phosphate acyltransferase PlsY
LRLLEGLLAVTLLYLLGATPCSYLIGRLKGIDIREHGSGNVGATNVGRVLGWRYYPLALALDLGKGVAAGLLAIHWGFSGSWLLLLSGLAVVGHDWSSFLRFSGGKGVSTSLGLLAALSWEAFLIAAVIWGLILWRTKLASVASLAALSLSPLSVWFFTRDIWGVVLMAALVVLALWRHRGNIGRLRRGEESRAFQRN